MNSVKKYFPTFALSPDLLDLQKQHVTIVTDKFPVYFALVTRPKRQSEDVGSEGGILTSPLNRDVQVILPQGAVKRDTQVQLQVSQNKLRHATSPGIHLLAINDQSLPCPDYRRTRRHGRFRIRRQSQGQSHRGH